MNQHTMLDPFMLVKEFHQKFGLAYSEGPRELPQDLSQFRRRFKQEELDEYVEAIADGDMEKQLDALVDLTYVVLGSAYLHGFDFNEAFRRVHEANMEKVRAQRKEDSVRGSTYDVVKPEGWKPPYLKDLVE